MQAAVYYRADQPLATEELELLEPQRNEVTVRVAAALYSSETPFR